MKKLKNKFLYKFLLILIINILFKNIYVFLLSLFILFIINKKTSFLLIIFFVVLISFSYTKKDFLRLGFVDIKNDNYIIVNKILYKCRVYNTSYDVGDVVITDDSTFVDNESLLKNNILFTSKKINKITTNIIKKSIYEIINNKNNSELYKNIFYNIYDENVSDQFNNISFGLTFYYFIFFIFKRKRKLGCFLLFVYSLFFGFQIKFILILIDLLLSFIDLDKVESVLLKLSIICLINKYLLLNYSFLLSIIISFVYLYKKKVDLSSISIIQSLLFGEVKIFNVIFYKAYMIEKITIFIFALFSLLFNFLEKPFFIYSDILDKVFGFLSISVRGKVSIFTLLLFLLIVSLFKIKSNLMKYLVLLFLLVIPFNTLTYNVEFIDVGQGDSILIVDPSKQQFVLVDTGSKYNYSKLKKELFSNGIYKIDYLIITHNDNDHNGNIDNLKKDFKIENIIEKGIDIKTNNLIFKYIDLPKSDNDNDNSLVYYLNVDNYLFLFTGDLSSKLENNIITDYSINDIDVLKVSHHGSKTATSDYFVGMIKPEFAVISTSGQYNHPNQEVIDTLNKFSVNTYITKNDGNIKFTFTKLLDYVSTSKNGFDIIFK